MVMDDLTLLQRRTVQSLPTAEEGSFGHFLISVAAAADEITAWGQSPIVRDRQLRMFLPTEPWLCSTVSSMAARNAAFSWTLEGPKSTCARIQDALHLSNFGRGWIDLMMGSVDLLSQDNGWFIEVIRDGSGAFMSLAHLDSASCQRTGDPQYPVIYTDRDGQAHKMAWHQVIDLTDMPSPIEKMNGVGLCAVSRVLRIAQILRDANLRKHEKLTGRFAGVLHIVSGIKKQMLDDAFAQAEHESDARNRFRYQPPIIVGTIDPDAQVRKESIPIADIPEGFNEEEFMKWYIAVLALGFHAEYQDLAPLPGGNLGTSQQSMVLHMKARGKGPELFQKMWEHALNFRVLPRNVQFKFTEKDYETEQIQATVRKLRAEARTQDITSGTLTPQIGRQMMEDDGELKHEYLEQMNEEDVTPEETLTDQEPPIPAEEVGEEDVVTDEEQAKALQDGDYWARQRTKWEKDAEEDIYQTLQEIREFVVKRVRQEVNAGA